MSSITRTIKPYKSLLTSMTILTLCIVAVFVAIIPGIKQTAEISMRVRELKEQNILLENKINVLNSIDETTLQTGLTLLTSAIPQSKSISTIFSTVEGTALQTGVTVVDMSVSQAGEIASVSAKTKSQEEKQIGATIVAFDVFLQGTYEQLRNFIILSSSVRRLLRVRNFSINISKTAATSATITLDTLYEPFPLSIGKALDAVDQITEKDQRVFEQLRQMQLVSGESIQLPPPSTNPSRVDPFSVL